MADCPPVHVGDIGTIFELTVEDCNGVVDISTATTLEIIFRKPDGTQVINLACLSGTGVDGKMRYKTTVSTEIDQEGDWLMQGRVEFGADDFKTTVVGFNVQGNI